MLLLRKSAQWKLWLKHDSYLHFKQKSFSFFVISEMVSVLAAQDKVSNGVAFYLRRKQLPLAIFHPIFLQHMKLQKDRSCSHLFAYMLAEKWVWLSRVHQLHYYIILKHTSFIHGSNLALSCRLIINLGTSVNCHGAIGEYGCDLLGGKIYLLFFTYSKQIGSFFHRQVLYILAFALHPLYSSLAKRLGNAKYQHLPSLNCRGHCESKTPPHCWYW